MKRVLIFIYEFIMRIMHIVMSIIAPFSPKIKERVTHTRKVLTSVPADFPEKRYWVHCASLGEYEQARPIIDALLARNYGVILSFFSPSGFIHAHIDHINLIKEYQRIDTRRNAIKWYTHFSPIALILVKYDIWYNHMAIMHAHKLPVYLISAHFTQLPWYFKKWSRPFKMRDIITHIFVQNEHSKKLLTDNDYNSVTNTGDTRMDRVLEVGKFKFSNSAVDVFLQESERVYVWGSTWPQDEKIALDFIASDKPGNKHMIAPHDINSERLEGLEGLLSGRNIEFAYITDNKINPDAIVLIVNTIGILKYLYRYAYIAHIGGGWDKGVHNVLEAITYKIPVTVGPRNRRFQEIQDLIAINVAKEINNADEFKKYAEYVENNTQQIQKQASNYVEQNSGATTRILKEINI